MTISFGFIIASVSQLGLEAVYSANVDFYIERQRIDCNHRKKTKKTENQEIDAEKGETHLRLIKWFYPIQIYLTVISANGINLINRKISRRRKYQRDSREFKPYWDSFHLIS